MSDAGVPIENLRSKDKSENIHITPVPLTEGLKMFYDPKYTTVGHGIGGGDPRAILDNGLRTRFSRLASTVYPLFVGVQPFETQVAEVNKNLTEWPHERRANVAIIMFPEPPEGIKPSQEYFDGFLKKLDNPLATDERGVSGFEATHVIEPEFVRGYVDTTTQEFFPNPKYNTLAQQERVFEVVQKLKEKEATLLESPADVIPDIVITVPKTPVSKPDSEDVW